MMAVTKGSAVEAWERAQEDRLKVDQRLAEARKAAAAELGHIVIGTTAARLPAAQLKAILDAVGNVGGDKALELLGAGKAGSSKRTEAAAGRSAANGAASPSAAGADA